MHTNTFIKEIEKVVSPGGVLLAEGALGIVTRAVLRLHSRSLDEIALMKTLKQTLTQRVFSTRAKYLKKRSCHHEWC